MSDSLPKADGCMLEGLESAVRRAGLGLALGVTAMVLGGLAQGLRRPKGRIVGRPFERLPVPLFATLWVGYLALAVKLWRPLPLQLSRRDHTLALALGSFFYTGGLGLTVWGRLALGNMYNVSTTQGVELYERHKLVTTGPFALVRHPMYLGAVLGALGGLLLYRTWTMVFFALHLPVFFVRAAREEEILEQEFGEQWRAYCRRVPPGVPLAWFRRHPRRARAASSERQ